MAFSLSALNGTNGFILDGETNGDLSGWWVSEAGDVNGDGIGDLIMGARKANGSGPNDSGTVYVVYGTTMPFPADFDVSTIDGTNGFVIEGNEFGAQLGRSVASAGDFNNDGIDDIIVGAWLANVDGKTDNGETYIIYGVDGGLPATLSLNDIDGSNGFRIDGTAWKDWSGWSVAGAGDVNDDGIDDVIIGNWGENPGGREDAGSAQVIFGSSNPFGGAASVNQSDLTSADGVKIEGANGKLDTGSLIDPGDGFGYAVSYAGDMNGDGIDDFIVGANRDNAGGDPFAGEYDYGAAYVVFGSGIGFPTGLKSSDLDGTNGFALPGYRTLDRGGYSVADAGDINNDGYDDLIVGNRELDTASEAGEAYVIYGSSTPFPASIDLQTLNGTDGTVFTGVNGGDFTGGSVNGAGDFNGDGIDDIIIGAQLADVGGNADAGKSYLIFGKTGGFGSSFDLGSITDADGIVFEGIAAGDWSGRQVSRAGDLNGDGLDDIVIGAYLADGNGNADAGQTYVVFGSRYYGTAVQTIDMTVTSNAAPVLIDRSDPVDKVVAATSSAGGTVSFTGGYGEGITYDQNTASGSTDIVTLTLENAAGDQRTQTLTIGITNMIPTSGDDTLIGTAGDDVIDLLAGDDIYAAIDGDDSIDGNLGNDSIIGDLGNDTINGGEGLDTIRGDAGNDSIDGGAGDDLINAGDGNDFAAGGDGNDTLNLISGDDTADGGLGDDRIFADDGNDLVNGGEGNDFVNGGVGRDTLNGDAGDDTMSGGGGQDLMDGGDGADSLTGSFGDDTITGGAGADTILGQGDNDVISGGADNDNIFGGTGDDVLNGDDGNDLMFGEGNNDTMDGGAGADTMAGGAGNDSILGGEGDDSIQGQGNNDTIDGGLGNDSILGQAGLDMIMGGDGNDFLDGGGAADTIDGGAGMDTLLGGTERDVLDGGADNDSVDGGGGNDTIDGGDGDDVINGGLGNDVMNGGSGNDTMDGGNGADMIFGGDGDDFIIGGIGADTIDGGAGADTIEGGVAIDLFIVNAGEGGDVLSGAGSADTFDFESGFATTTITDFGIGADQIDLVDVTTATTFDDLVITYTTDASVDLGGGDVITLLGVTGGLDASDFIF